MAEYIEREALLNEAKKRAKAFSCALIYEAIKEAPTADVVEIVHGEWIKKGMITRCSNCDSRALYNNHQDLVLSAICPHCGAKMDGERRTDNV